MEVPVGGGNRIPGVLHSSEGDRSFFATFRSGEDEERSPGARSEDNAVASHSAVTSEHGEGDDDYLQQGNESLR